MADVFTSLEAILERGFPRPRDPTKAKVQLAVLFYVTKGVRAVHAVRLLADQRLLHEAWLPLRALYNSAVDFLWLAQDIANRSELFYDSVSVSLEAYFRRLSTAGVAFSQEQMSRIEHNRVEFEAVSDAFKDRKGRIRKHWAPGDLRTRAIQLAERNPDFKVLAESYDWLYATLSDYEHSAPYLAFQYLSPTSTALSSRLTDEISSRFGEQIGQMVGILFGLILDEACKQGMLDRKEIIAGASGAAS